MSKPSDIPQDVWVAAADVTRQGLLANRLDEAVARALMAERMTERRRCAEKAENFRHDNPFPTVYGAIAAAIRKGD